MPIVHTLGMNEIWFGILFLLAAELGVKTPPFGLNLFVMKTVAPEDVTIADICTAAAPYVLMDTVAIGIMLLFQILVTILPAVMRA